MSLYINNNAANDVQASSKQVKSSVAPRENTARDEEIRRRAYETYLEPGEQLGSELGEWFQAEYELKRLALAQES